jgi:DNA-binding MarR family transcriptional regulator
MPKPHVTTLIDRLIAEKMVERLFDPKDRRIVNVRITEKGVNDFNAIKLEISQELRIKLEKLDVEKLEILSVASKQVKDILMTVLVEPSSCTNSDSCKE